MFALKFLNPVGQEATTLYEKAADARAHAKEVVGSCTKIRIVAATAEEIAEYHYWMNEAQEDDPDAAYERHLENRGWMETMRDEEMEARFSRW